MEGSTIMIRYAVFFTTMLLAVVILPSGVASEVRSLVLVTYVGNSDVRLTIPEIRRLYLGLPTAQDSHLVAIINRTESLLYQVFLQKALFMSAPLYERQLLTNVVRRRGYRLQLYEDQQELLHALRTQQNAVTYMWRDDIKPNSGMVVISVIWQGRVN